MDDTDDIEVEHNLGFYEEVWNEGEHVSCVIERLLLTPKTESFPQRHSLFRTRCTINGKFCNIVIDSGSTENIISNKLVTTLNLKTSPHPTPFKVGWIKKGGEAQVSAISTVPLSIGNIYKNHIICDILDKDVYHVSLGCPW